MEQQDEPTSDPEESPQPQNADTTQQGDNVSVTANVENQSGISNDENGQIASRKDQLLLPHLADPANSVPAPNQRSPPSVTLPNSNHTHKQLTSENCPPNDTQNNQLLPNIAEPPFPCLHCSFVATNLEAGLLHERNCLYRPFPPTDPDLEQANDIEVSANLGRTLAIMSHLQLTAGNLLTIIRFIRSLSDSDGLLPMENSPAVDNLLHEYRRETTPEDRNQNECMSDYEGRNSRRELQGEAAGSASMSTSLDLSMASSTANCNMMPMPPPNLNLPNPRMLAEIRNLHQWLLARAQQHEAASSIANQSQASEQMQQTQKTPSQRPGMPLAEIRTNNSPIEGASTTNRNGRNIHKKRQNKKSSSCDWKNLAKYYKQESMKCQDGRQREPSAPSVEDESTVAANPTTSSSSGFGSAEVSGEAFIPTSSTSKRTKASAPFGLAGYSNLLIVLPTSEPSYRPNLDMSPLSPINFGIILPVRDEADATKTCQSRGGDESDSK